MTKNDEKIVLLKKKLDEKRSKWEKSKTECNKRTTTNAVLEVFGKTFNLNVLGKDELIRLVCFLESQVVSAKELHCESDLSYGGFPVYDWIDDIMLKLNIISLRDEEKAIKKMEKQLDALMSDDFKTETELDKIAKELDF